jgi:hypothetical protein
MPISKMEVNCSQNGIPYMCQSCRKEMFSERHADVTYIFAEGSINIFTVAGGCNVGAAIDVAETGGHGRGPGLIPVG